MNNSKTILITGASGNLGEKLCQHLEGRYVLKLLDIAPKGNRKVMQADLSVWNEKWVSLFQDVNTVVHLASNPNERQSWSNLVKPNIDAMINTFAAVAKTGVERMVFASSNHVMDGYREAPEFKQITTDIPARPGMRYLVDGHMCDTTPYASAKLFGERLGKCYADIHGLSFIAVRIGSVRPGDNKAKDIGPKHDEWSRMMWLSNRDFCHLMEQCIEADSSIRFAVINGMSSNSGMRWDIQYGREVIGYEPLDDVTQSEA